MEQNNWRLSKNSYLEQSETLFERWGYNQKPNPCFQAVIHRPNLYYSKISKRKLKKEYAISSGTGKNRTSQTVSSTLHLEGQARYFTVLDRHKIKLDKNKMDSKFIKSHQCSLERSHAVLTEINPEFWSRPNPFSTKTDYCRSTNHKNLQKQNNEDFFIQLLYAWLHLTNNSTPPPYL